MNSTKPEKCKKLDNELSEASEDEKNENNNNNYDSDTIKNDLVNTNDLMDIELNSIKIYKSLMNINSRLYKASLNGVQNFENVTKLNLTNNNLRVIPKTIIELSALETLILDNNFITKLPRIMKEMIYIKQLSLVNNGLTQFPLVINYFKNIEILNLSNNKLGDLPDSCKWLKNLEILNISRNRFNYIPKCIHTGLPKLKILDVSENHKMNLNRKVFSNDLKELYAKNNELVPALFPGWIFHSTIIEFDEINFQNTCFEIISVRKAHKQIRIKKLNLEQNFLNDELLMMLLKNIDSVNYLSIGNTSSSRIRQNTFIEFPKKFNNPQNVIELKINRTGLSKILATIENFSTLTKLELQYNSISWLPDEIVNLKRLENLTINNNSLVMLPENLGQMVSLRILSASYNSITSLPDSIRYLKNIEFIDLYNNCLNELPKDINNLKSLKGLDFEQNLINTNNFELPASYENLRDQLGDNSNDLKLRIIGPQILQLTPDGSRSSSVSSDDRYSQSSCSTNHSSNNSQTQNDWNTEYNSSDEFDPYNIPLVPKVPQPRYIMYNKTKFCPADLHPRRIQDILAEKFSQGKVELPPLPVEGQFDDVEY